MLPLLLQLAATVARPHVTISLLPEFTAVVAGMPERLALRFQVEPGWHIYWKNPGETGVATTANWTLPAGFTVDSLDYPTPSRLDVAGVVTHIMAGDVVLQAKINPPARLTSRVAQLTAHVRYGVCKDVCYPGEAALSIAMPVMTDAGPHAGWRAVDSIFAAARPRTGGLAVRVSRTRDTAIISLTPPADCRAGTVTFFPSDRDAAPAAVTAPMRQGCTETVIRVPWRGPPAAVVRGVVVVGESRQGYAIP